MTGSCYSIELFISSMPICCCVVCYAAPQALDAKMQAGVYESPSTKRSTARSLCKVLAHC